MNYTNFLMIILLLLRQGVHCDLEHLELLNVVGWGIEKQLRTNYGAMLGPKGGGYFSGILSRMNPFGSKGKEKLEPQKDLEELAQIYGALNSADTAALFFLSKECHAEGGGLLDPKTDPTLCTNYKNHLIKQTQNRISTVNSRVIKSSGWLECPPQWARHALTVQGLLQGIDPKNLLEYRVNTAIANALDGEEAPGAGPVGGQNAEEAIEKEYAEQMAMAGDSFKATESAVAQANEQQPSPQMQASDQPGSLEQANLPLESQAQPAIQTQPQLQPQTQLQPNLEADLEADSQPGLQVQPVIQAQTQPDLQPQAQPNLPSPPQAKTHQVYPSEQILNSVMSHGNIVSILI